MRKVVATVYVSLDGVIDRPEKWSLKYFSEQSAAYQTQLVSKADILLQGRLSYERFAQVWNKPAEDPFDNRMYEVPKVLVSRSLSEGAWHNSTVADDPVKAVEELIQDGDGLVLTYGFGSIAYALLDAGLLDEIHVWVHPVLARAAGTEDVLFRPGTGNVPLSLIDSTTLDSGVTILHLAVQRG